MAARHGRRPPRAGLSPEAAAGELGDRLADAVRLRLRADVPVGAYLSGGLDSSVIGSLVRQVDASPLETFAVRFRDPAFDETAEQRRMAGLLGTDHHEIVCGPDEIAGSLADVVWHCESPLLRTAPVPLYLLSGLVRDAGMKVVLTGEGADELLAGYSIFKEDRVRRFWARPARLGGAPGAVLAPAPRGAGGRRPGQRHVGPVLRARPGRTDLPFYAHLTRWHNTAWTLRCSIPTCGPPRQRATTGRRDTLRPCLRGGPRGTRWPGRSGSRSPRSCRGTCCRARATGWPWRTASRCATRSSTPPWSTSAPVCPPTTSSSGLHDKVALRRLASRTLPPEIWRRPKQPYRAP